MNIINISDKSHLNGLITIESNLRKSEYLKRNTAKTKEIATKSKITNTKFDKKRIQKMKKKLIIKKD